MDAMEAHLAQKAKARHTRNALDRAKAKAYRVAKIVYDSPDLGSHYHRGEESHAVATMDDVFWLRKHYVTYHYRNRHLCSGMWCGHGNPRRYRGANHVTLQEQHADAAFRDVLWELA